MFKGKGSNPASLVNLKVITPEIAKDYQARGVASRLANKVAQEEFKVSAKAFQAIMGELPQLSALDVLRMAMYTALQNDNFEDAARYANMVAEYEQPKLQRIDQTTTTRIVDLSDEELKKIILEENLQDIPPV